MSLTDRNGSRRASRHAAKQRHRTMRLTALGIVSIIAAVVAVLLLNGFLSDGDHGEATTWSTSTYTGGPRLAVDRTLVDEGSVPYSHEVKATYHVKNVGDQPLTFQTPTVDIVVGC